MTEFGIIVGAVFGIAVLVAVGIVYFVWRDSRRRAAIRDAQPSMGQWLSSMSDAQLPPVVVRSYTAGNQSDATREYVQEAGLLAARGYFPTSQSWSNTQPGASDILAGGILAFGNQGGTLSVTYSRR